VAGGFPLLRMTPRDRYTPWIQKCSFLEADFWPSPRFVPWTSGPPYSP